MTDAVHQGEKIQNNREDGDIAQGKKREKSGRGDKTGPNKALGNRTDEIRLAFEETQRETGFTFEGESGRKTSLGEE